MRLELEQLGYKFDPDQRDVYYSWRKLVGHKGDNGTDQYYLFQHLNGLGYSANLPQSDADAASAENIFKVELGKLDDSVFSDINDTDGNVVDRSVIEAMAMLMFQHCRTAFGNDCKGLDSGMIYENGFQSQLTKFKNKIMKMVGFRVLP